MAKSGNQAIAIRSQDKKKVMKAGNKDMAAKKEAQAQKTESRRLLYTLSKNPEALQTYTALGRQEKERFRALWKEDPGFSFTEQFRSRTISKLNTTEDLEAPDLIN